MQQTYLQPYLDAARQHGGGFASLLWASPKTQAARFQILMTAANLQGRTVLDAGCGRADFLDFLLLHDVQPLHYIGLEAVAELAEAAEMKRHRQATIVRGDFVIDSATLACGADAIVFSGSLNTLDAPHFYRVIERAYAAANQTIAFNFLDSRTLAGKKYLTWHCQADVEKFASQLADRVNVWEGYLDGDCTIVMSKSVESPADRRHP